MSLPYFLRLACLCLGVWFAVQLGTGWMVALLSPRLIQWAGRLQARRAATLLFTMRLLPGAAGAGVVMLICVPSYVLFEPYGAEEEVGAWCLGGALLCLLAWGLALVRTGRAALHSAQYLRRCRREAHKTWTASQPPTVWVVDDCSPGLALLGIFRPHLVVSAKLAQALPAEEFSAALAHELAHWAARDNLKRLFFLLTPDPFPFGGGLRRLERGWARFSEWAADDRAVQGDPRLSLSLAAALVRVARLGLGPAASPLMSTLIADRCGLAERVNRLLEEDRRPSPVISRGFMAGGAVLLGLAVVVPVVSALNWFHSVLEFLMH